MWVVAGAMLLFAATSTASPAPPGPDSTGVFTPSDLALRAYAQGRLLEVRGAYRDALAEYFRAYVLDQRSLPVVRRVADLAARLGENETALEYAERALRIDSQDPRSLWIKGSTLFNLGREKEALGALEAAVSADSTQLEYVQTLGRVAEQLDSIVIVERAYSRAVVLDEDDGENWFQLAAAQARLGRFAEAERNLAHAAELAPMRPGQLFLQAWIQESLGRADRAIGLYEHHLEVHPMDQAARRRLVHLYSQKSRWNDAYAQARQVSKADPGNFDALLVEADLAFRAKHSEAGMSAVRRLAELAEEDPSRIGGAAALLARNGHKADAIRIVDGWSSRHPGNLRGVLLASRIRALAGDSQGAIQLARRAVEAAPDSILPREVLARLYQDQKRFGDAEQVLLEGRRRVPGDFGLSLDLATCREEKGDTQGAEAAARDAVRIDPDNARVLNFLGYLLADHNRELEEAKSLILRAVSQDPDNGAFVDSLGWVYYRLGRLADAREQLERAIQLDVGDPVVHEHLGDVYRDLKMFDQAKDQYRQCLSGDASNARVRAKLVAIP